MRRATELDQELIAEVPRLHQVGQRGGNLFTAVQLGQELLGMVGNPMIGRRGAPVPFFAGEEPVVGQQDLPCPALELSTQGLEGLPEQGFDGGADLLAVLFGGVDAAAPAGVLAGRGADAIHRC